LAEVYGRLPGKESEARRERKIVSRLPDDADWPDLYMQEALSLQVGKQARIDRSNALRRAGELGQAIAVLRETVQLYPDFDEAWLALGLALLQVRDYPAAEAALQEAVRFGPGRVESRFQLGLARYHQRKQRPPALTQAVDDFRQAIRLSPAGGRAHFMLGVCLQEQGDPGNQEEALRAYRVALLYSPDFPEAHRNLGQLLAELGREAALAGQLQRLFGCPAIIDVAAAIRMEALAHLRQAQQLAPGDGVTREALNRLLQEIPSGLGDKARTGPGT
jgi:tetratricopeptide (TPR) repeat protein